jgi:hypothetical protein
MASPHSPKQNHILAALPEADYARLLPNLELIPMPLGWAVYESGGHTSYLYFPTTSLVSLLYLMEDGASAVDSPTSALGRNRSLPCVPDQGKSGHWKEVISLD